MITEGEPCGLSHLHLDQNEQTDLFIVKMIDQQLACQIQLTC